MVPTNNILFVGTVPTNNFLFVGTVPTDNFLFVGTVPTNNFFLSGISYMFYFRGISRGDGPEGFSKPNILYVKWPKPKPKTVNCD